MAQNYDFLVALLLDDVGLHEYDLHVETLVFFLLEKPQVILLKKTRLGLFLGYAIASPIELSSLQLLVRIKYVGSGPYSLFLGTRQLRGFVPELLYSAPGEEFELGNWRQLRN